MMELLRQKLQDVLRHIAVAFPFAMQLGLEQRWHLGRRPGRRNLTDKLYVNTGRLLRAFLPQKPGNVYRYRIGDSTLELRYGVDLSQVPYARIHEYGGTIVPVRARVLAWVWEGKRPTTAAEWRKARREGRAAYARRVRIPARPYFEPALRYVIEEWLPREVERVWAQQ